MKATKVEFGYYYWDFTFPSPSEPEWASFSDRWYQLDAPCFGLMDGYYNLQKRFPTPPHQIILASPLASNETDLSFFESGQKSPSKFIHTLPNIRASTLCEYLGWKGPLLCIQNDPITLIQGLFESHQFFIHNKKTIWTLSIEKKEGDHHYRSHYFIFSTDPISKGDGYRFSSLFTTDILNTSEDLSASDHLLLQKLDKLEKWPHNSFCKIGQNWYIENLKI